MPLFKKSETKPPKPDRRAVWQEVADGLGGAFVEGERKTQDEVVVEDGPWTLTLDLHVVSTGEVVVTYTRVKAHFVGRGDVKLTIRARNILDGLLEILGFGGVAPGRRTFAKKYVVRGRPLQRLRNVLSGAVTEVILAQPSVRVDVGRAERKVRKLHGEDVARVSAYTTGVILDPDRIVGLFHVVRATLDALESAGLAQPLPE